MNAWSQSQYSGEVERKATQKRYMFNICIWGGEEYVIKELASAYCSGDVNKFNKEFRVIYDIRGKKVKVDD